MSYKSSFNLHNINVYLLISSIFCIIAWVTTLPILFGQKTLGTFPYQIFVFASCIMLICAIVFTFDSIRFIMIKIKTKKWNWHKTKTDIFITMFPTVMLTIGWYILYGFAYLATTQYVYVYANVPESFMDIQNATIVELAITAWAMNAQIIVLALVSIQIIINIINIIITKLKRS